MDLLKEVIEATRRIHRAQKDLHFTRQGLGWRLDREGFAAVADHTIEHMLEQGSSKRRFLDIRSVCK